jgi:hypothetical protein
MLYKMDLLCVDETLYSVVNIRINLMQHVMSKRQRKLLRRNAKRYRVELGKVQITPEKERLYEMHKPRFKGMCTIAWLIICRKEWQAKSLTPAKCASTRATRWWP